MSEKKRILIAPLNWGLGHATRCIPIINALITNNFTPIIASDGVALDFLKKEFPLLDAIALPSYGIKYPKRGGNFKLKMLWNTPKIITAIKKEQKLIKQLSKEITLNGIISDNRFGIYHQEIPSVFITHQINVLTGNTTWLSSKMHQHIIKKFKECWVPDLKANPNLSGKLGHLKNTSLPIKYIGSISRLSKKELPKKYDLMVILSGPEPQRTLLEEKLMEELASYNKPILFIRGKIENQQTITKQKHLTVCNFMNSKELEIAFNESDLIIARSGYTTIMDLAKLEKKAFFIPTPGQYEQEYLAKRFEKLKMIPYSTQKEFTVQRLYEIKNYKGFTGFNATSFKNLNTLFSLFHGK